MNPWDVLVARSVATAQQGSVSLEFGRVKAVAGSKATVTLGGVDIPGVPVMKQYNATAGDWAWCLRQGTLLVVIGCTNGKVNDDWKGVS